MQETADELSESDRKKVLSLFNQLHFNRHAAPIEEDSTLSKDLELAKSFATQHRNSEIYKKIARRLRDTIPNKIVKGSPGEFLYACIKQTRETGDRCTPECHSYIRDVMESDCRSDAYVVTTNGKLRKINNDENITAKVYLEANQAVSKNALNKVKEGHITVDLLSRTNEEIVWQPVNEKGHGWLFGVAGVALVIGVILMIYLIKSRKGTLKVEN